MKIKEIIERLSEEIKSFPSTKAAYLYEHEENINPAYTDLEHCSDLCPGESRIWVLRSDLILALGIKNTASCFPGTKLSTKIAPELHQYFDFRDRFGHPSLAIPEGDYDGGVLYAGRLYHTKNSIELWLLSGRYHTGYLNAIQKILLEQYIALRVMQVMSNVHVVFYDFYKQQQKEHYTLFFTGKMSSSLEPKRIYSLDTLGEVALGQLSNYYLQQDKLEQFAELIEGIPLMNEPAEPESPFEVDISDEEMLGHAFGRGSNLYQKSIR